MRKNKTVHLRDECPETPLDCTNDDCKQQIKRKDFEEHVERQCEERIVQCPFFKFGCTVDNIKAKALSDHLEESKFEHISMKFDFITAKVECQYVG